MFHPHLRIAYLYPHPSQQMKITFKKRSDTKHVVSYSTPLGVEHWFEADDFLVLHDLSHFALESILHFRTAFWGLMEQGISQEVFENKDARNALSLSHDAWYAEHLANLFLMELSQGRWEDIQKIFISALRQTNPEIPLFHLENKEVEKIRALLVRLVAEWNSLGSGDKMEVEF